MTALSAGFMTILVFGCASAPAASDLGAPARPPVAAAAKTEARQPVRASGLFSADARIEGNVAVVPGTKLYPTAAAAAAAAPSDSTGSVTRAALEQGSFAIHRVTGAASGVVQVRTGAIPRDCLDDSNESGDGPRYAIDAFVARGQLVGRVGEDIVVENADGSGARVERGAPLIVFDDGHAELLDVALGNIVGPIARSKIALATPDATTTAKPPWRHALVPLACDPRPMPADVWKKKNEAVRDEQRKKNAEQESQRRYEACLEKERREPKPRPAAREASPLGLGSITLSCAELQAQGMFAGQRVMAFDDFGMRGSGEVEIPYCVPSADGVLPSDVKSFSSTVGASPTPDTFLAEIGRTCGSVRSLVPAREVAARRSAGLGAIGTGRMGRAPDPPSMPRAGSAVTWLDGTPAGTVRRTGSIPSSALTESSGERQCVSVPPFAAPLCHAKSDLCAPPGCTDRTGKPARR